MKAQSSIQVLRYFLLKKIFCGGSGGSLMIAKKYILDYQEERSRKNQKLDFWITYYLNVAKVTNFKITILLQGEPKKLY
jgi:hypothetical protein